MAFATVLNTFCASLGCSNKELAESCGISMSALSRYRNGKRTPRAGSDVINQLAGGISKIAQERGVASASSEAAVRDALRNGLVNVQPLGPSFSARVDSLMKLLGVKNADVAVPLHLDSSYISRIRRGERTPNDKKRFAGVVAQVAALRCMERGMLDEVVSLVGAAESQWKADQLDIDNVGVLSEVIARWLLGNQVVESDIAAVDTLLRDIDNRYWQEVLDKSRNSKSVLSCAIKSGERHSERPVFFCGENFMWRAEMAFLEGASECGAKNLFMSSDMPALETVMSPENMARYQQGVLELIDKGCHVTVVHSTDRPLRETLQSLQMWVPLYMTGKVTPLYLEGATSRLFCHVNNVCECCAMASEAVRGHEEAGRYYLTFNPEDIEYYRSKMDFILEQTSVLLELYRNDDEEGMRKFEREDALRQATGRGREIRAGQYDNLRIMLYQGDCVVVYSNHPLQHRIVIRHPKLRYVVSHMA